MLFNFYFDADAKVRDRAVRALQSWLFSRGSELSYEEFLKLWKGLFFCFWLSDKPDGQHALAVLIAQLIHSLPDSREGSDGREDSPAMLFIRSFWETIGHEWGRIDKYRLNKYYYFMGQMLWEAFQLLARSAPEDDPANWDSDLVSAYVSLLKSVPFNYANPAFSEAIRNYIVENYFVLLRKAAKRLSFSAELSVMLCDPMVHAAAYCKSKVFFTQACENLLQGILPEEADDDEGEVGEESYDEEEEGGDEENSEGEDEDEENSVGEEEESNEEEDEKVDESDDMDSEESDCCGGEQCCEDSEDSEDSEAFETLLNYERLPEHIFQVGGNDNVSLRNRQFLYDLSKIVEEVRDSSMSGCC
jgi:ribosomal RNA-processing protein 1